MFRNEPAAPSRLTVLYDSSCGFCVACKRWLERHDSSPALRFIPARSGVAARLYPELSDAEAEELTVVSDEGLVYRGASAWIMCLWALPDYREWAIRLSAPALLPLARQAFELLSLNRKTVSLRLGLLPETELAETLRQVPAAACTRTPHS